MRGLRGINAFSQYGNISKFQPISSRRLLLCTSCKSGRKPTDVKVLIRMESTRTHVSGRRESTSDTDYVVTSSGATTSSIIAGEVEKFERLSSAWWDPLGGMKELHSMNRLRVPFIRDGLLQCRGKQTDNKVIPKPLQGYNILDIGCGGGILCEPLGRLGATVIGIDPGKESISIADKHLTDDLRNNVSYQCATIEEFVEGGNVENFDAVVMSEVIEHVDNPQTFIKSAAEALKPNGSLFLTTLNRTMESWMGAVVAWEYVLRKLPVGTHDWRKFLTPTECDKLMKSNGLRTVIIHGMNFNPISNSWTWSSRRGINYAIHAVKN